MKTNIPKDVILEFLQTGTIHGKLSSNPLIDVDGNTLRTVWHAYCFVTNTWYDYSKEKRIAVNYLCSSGTDILMSAAEELIRLELAFRESKPLDYGSEHRFMLKMDQVRWIAEKTKAVSSIKT